MKTWWSSGLKILLSVLQWRATFSTKHSMCTYRTRCFSATNWRRGVELILQESIRVNDPPKGENVGAVVSVDTTVQEKNITYPTDDKLYKKIIKKCWIIADNEKIDLRQSYTQVIKKLGNQQRFKNTKMELKQPESR